jgi:hypothetical protein
MASSLTGVRCASGTAPMRGLMCSAILESLGADLPGPLGGTGYRAASAQRRAAGYPETGGLADELGLR